MKQAELRKVRQGLSRKALMIHNLDSTKTLNHLPLPLSLPLFLSLSLSLSLPICISISISTVRVKDS